MLIFLYGSDGLRLSRKLQDILARHQKVRPGGLNLIRLDFSRDGFDDFRESLETRPMFAAKKLIVLEQPFASRDLSAKLLNYLREDHSCLTENILVLVETGEIDARHPLLAFLKKNAQTQEFPALSGAALKTWVKREVVRLGGQIDPSAVEKLAVNFSQDSWALLNEIVKLVSFAQGRMIGESDVDQLAGTKAKIEANVFKTIDAIAAGDKKTALKLLSQHFAQGVSPVYLLTMIAYQFRNLLIARDLLDRGRSGLAIGRATGWQGFLAHKYSALVQRFTRSRLEGIYNQILETDFKIKTGKADPRRALELLVVEI